MFGTYRLILAVLVVVTHLHVTVAGRNLGVAAVVQFFILSGYVMTAMVRTHYPVLGRATAHFYVDRALRIVPLYLFFLLLTLAWFWFDPGFLRGELTVPVLAAHVLILPLNYYTHWPELHRAILIPQAASLALEEHFYLVFPVVLARRTLFWLAYAASFAVFALAMANRIPPIEFGYVLLSGTMFFFLLGSLLRDQVEGTVPAWLVAALYLAIAGLAAVIAGKGKLGVGYDAELLTGLLVGVPVIAALARLRPSRLDDMAGHLSYGTFLCHMIVIAAGYRWLPGGRGTLWFGVVVVVASVAVGAAGWWLVERPTAEFRYELRRRWKTR